MDQLRSVGYDSAAAPRRIRITTASGIEWVPRLTLDKIEVLGQRHSNFEVIAHTLPPTAAVDGLLGLDFLRGWRLTIDFRTARIVLE